MIGTTLSLLLAHQGGWDELLLVAAPIAVLVLILWVANRRAGRAQQARDQAAAGDEGRASGETDTPSGTEQDAR